MATETRNYHEATVECQDCHWTTDLSVLSDTNPSRCPECGGEILALGTEMSFDDWAALPYEE